MQRVAGHLDVAFDDLQPGVAAGGVGVISLGTTVPEGRAVELDPDAPSGDSHVWRATREFTAVAELLESVDWGALDVLLHDLPPGAERTFQYAEFLGPDVAFVLVTVPSALARGVVARSADALRRLPNPVAGYVENMSGYWCESCRTVRPLFPEGGVDLGIPCLGRVPFDPALAAASDAGVPLDGPDRPAARAVSEIAERVVAFLESR